MMVKLVTRCGCTKVRDIDRFMAGDVWREALSYESHLDVSATHEPVTMPPLMYREFRFRGRMDNGMRIYEEELQ